MIPVHWTGNNLTVNGVALHYHRTGHDDKPPLLLQHGLLDDGQCWVQSPVELQDQYDIVMPDARGLVIIVFSQ